jgi:MFS family permease
MFGMLVVMLSTGQAISRTGRYRIYPIIGGVVMTVGMVILLALKVNTSTATSSLLTLGVGLGMGFIMQITMLITQNSVPLRDMGAASGSVTLFRTIGGSLGIALLGSIYTQQVTDSLSRSLGARGGALVSGGAHIPPSAVRKLPTALKHAFEQAVTTGVHGTFIGGAVLSALAFLLALMIREVPLRGKDSATPPVDI